MLSKKNLNFNERTLLAFNAPASKGAKNSLKGRFSLFLALCLLSLALSVAQAQATEELVLWNTLGSDSELQNSRIGPPVIPLQTLAYSPAMYGNGVLSDNDDPVIRIPKSVLNTEEGTICLWMKLVSVPPNYPNATLHQFAFIENSSNLGFEFSANDGRAHSGWLGRIWGKYTVYSINRFGNTSTASLGTNGEDIFLTVRWNQNGVPGHGTEKFVLYRNDVKMSIYYSELTGAEWLDEFSGDLILNRALYNPAYASGTVDLDLIYDDIKIYEASLSDQDIIDLYSGGEPVLSVSPLSIDFGSVLVGETATEQVTVTNTGTADSILNISSISGIDADKFSVDPTPFALSPGESQILDVSFTPDGVGSFSASLDIDSDGGSESVDLTGQGYTFMPQTWVKHPSNPVLDLGPSGSWDDYGVGNPTVLFNGTEYQMWYSGHDGSSYRIGYATSSDGIVWVKHPDNPVLELGASGAWDGKHVARPTVLFDGTEYQMWYDGAGPASWQFGYATSADGIVWVKHPDNPVLNPGESGTWDDDHIGSPTVLFNGTEYQMWYHGIVSNVTRIGYATSADGIVWVKHPDNPVLNPGESGTWESLLIAHPTVLFNGAGYQMWYSGHDGSSYRIGYATSSDGIEWVKHPDNPVLDIGESGTWDDIHVSEPTVLFDGTGHHMWHGGHDGSNMRIGYATSTPPLPHITVSPDPIDFGDVIVGEEATVTVSIGNTGDAVLSVSDITSTLDGLEISPTSLDVEPDATDDVILTLIASTVGEISGTLTIESNDPDSPTEIDITGNAQLSEVNRGLSLDGVDDWCELTDFAVPETFTVEMWVNPNSTDDDQCFIGKHTADGNNIFWFGYYSGGFQVMVRSDYHAEGEKITGFHHLAVIVEKTTSSSVTVYRNGKLLWQTTLAGSIGDTTGKPWVLGQDWDSNPLRSTDFFNGTIDEVRIWNSARTQEQVESTMNTTLAGDEPGLIGYWNFDDGTANDLTGNGNDGTLMGGAQIIPLVGTWPPKLIGDVTGDGTISALDAAYILQYVVGLRDSFPAGMLTSPGATPRDYILSLPEIRARAGDRIQIPIEINDATGLFAGGVTLKYDATVLRAVGIAAFDILNGAYWKGSTDVTGETRFAFASTQTMKGNGRMLVVEFEVMPNTKGMTSALTLENVNLSNSRSVTKINGEVHVIPSTFALFQNFPNPFNPDTWLPYQLPNDAPVTIRIYNTKGQLIRTLNLGDKQAGVYAAKNQAAYWNGRDRLGEKVASGVYYYTLEAGEFRATRKMVIMK